MKAWFPSLKNIWTQFQTFRQTTPPSNPSAGDVRLYVDSSDSLLKLKYPSGNVVIVPDSAQTLGGFMTKYTVDLSGLTSASINVSNYANCDIIVKIAGKSVSDSTAFRVNGSSVAAYDWRYYNDLTLGSLTGDTQIKLNQSTSNQETFKIFFGGLSGARMAFNWRGREDNNNVVEGAARYNSNGFPTSFSILTAGGVATFGAGSTLTIITYPD